MGPRPLAFLIQTRAFSQSGPLFHLPPTRELWMDSGLSLPRGYFKQDRGDILGTPLPGSLVLAATPGRHLRGTLRVVGRAGQGREGPSLGLVVPPRGLGQ